MRVSEYFSLGLTQPSLDFVDVHIDRDTPLFIDPRSLAQLETPWANACISSVQSFFDAVLGKIALGDNAAAIDLLSYLREPNETHLGLSSKRSRGNALGDELAEEFELALSKSAAAKSGLISDLEDTALFVEGIGRDRISDITTNIIRKQLIEYTQDMCRFYQIPLTPHVASGFAWDNRTGQWHALHSEMPTPGDELLLLVPKAVVRLEMHVNAEHYFRHDILNFLVSRENAASSLNTAVKKKRKTKVAVEKKYREKYNTGRPGTAKRINTAISAENPELRDSYRAQRATAHSFSLNHAAIADVTGTPGPNLRELLDAVLRLPPGRENAKDYERSIKALLTELFYPHLIYPKPQEPLHEGREVVDLCYTNDSQYGFFRWLSDNYPAPQVFIECKNYSGAIGNPEIHQLRSRLAPSRGMFGMLFYRGYADKERIWRGCLDAFHDDTKFMIPLDDKDLTTLVDEYLRPTDPEAFGFLHKLFLRIINN